MQAPHVYRSDFGTLYSAGLIVRQGNGSKLYDLDEQTRVQELVLDRKGILPFVHPPFEALIFAPLTRFSFFPAYLLWGLINISLWIYLTYLIRSVAPRPQQTFQYLILCFGFFPLLINLYQGQTSLLVLVLYSLSFISLKRNQDFRAGVFLGFGLLKLQVVLPFALICFLCRKWKLIFGFSVAVLLLGALSILVVGPAGVVSYIHLVIDIVKHPSNPAYAITKPWDTASIRGFFGFLLVGRVSPKWINTAVTCSSASLIVFTAWRWRREQERQGSASLQFGFAAALAASLVTTFHFFTHDLSLMLLAVLLVIGTSQWKEKSKLRLVMGACVLLLYTLPPLFMFGDPDGRYELKPLLVPVLLAFVFAVLKLAGNTAGSRDPLSRAGN